MKGTRIKEQLFRLLRTLQSGKDPDLFVRNADAAQNAIDIFAGDWVSAFPAKAQVQAGAAPLFEDPRLLWMFGQVDPSGHTVLELGPMEGAHTAMLLDRGAQSVVGVEANRQAFLKCLITKEILDLKAARFICADFVSYLESNPAPVDIVLASGILYHMAEPLRVLHGIAKQAPTLFLWTHYYDAERIATYRGHRGLFVGAETMEWGGFSCEVQKRMYGPHRWHARHRGASTRHSAWLKRDDLLAALRHYGYTQITIGNDEPDHPHGPAWSLVAQKG